MPALDLALNDEQVLLLQTVERLAACVEQPGWRDLADLGLCGLTIPQQAGGFGGGFADVAIVMGVLGPALAGADWLGHVAAAMMLGRHETEDGGLADLATGDWRAAVICAASSASLPEVDHSGRIDGTARFVSGAAGAARFVVASTDGLWLVSADQSGIEVEERAMQDGTVTATVHFAGVQGQPIEDNPAAIEELIRIGRCAEAVGLMQRCLIDTADYLIQRRQFGAPLATFQALRHRLADMNLAALQAQALTEVAVVAADCGAADRGAAIAAASVAVRDAARVVGEGAVQLHGAMGLTEELTLGARFRRLLAIAAAMGSEASLLAAVA